MNDDPLLINLRHPKLNAAATMAEAADEIERLRGLIINALDAYDNFDNSQQSHERWIVAPEYLRKAVGR